MSAEAGMNFIAQHMASRGRYVTVGSGLRAGHPGFDSQQVQGRDNFSSPVHLDQWFSTFVRPWPGKFFFYKTRARPNKFTRKYLSNFI
jgi:hypothetical protein